MLYFSSNCADFKQITEGIDTNGRWQSIARRGPAKVIDWIQGLFFRVFHFFKGEQEDSVTEKEIISMVDEAHEKGVLQKDEAEMIQNIFAFEDKEVGVVMTHRSSVAAFAMDDLLKDVVNHMMEEENSRYPVCGEDMDDIRGLIHYKDALKFFTQNSWAKFKPLKELPGLIRKVTFVPETRHIVSFFVPCRPDRYIWRLWWMNMVRQQVS